jgi:glycosyltransferase involved in cell wall biosynthesis
MVVGETAADLGDMAYFAEQHGVEPLIVPELSRIVNPFSDVLAVWRLTRIMRRIQPDVVHTHTSKGGFIGRVAARMAGAPVVVHTFHSRVYRGRFSPVTTPIYLRLERFAARLSDSIITLTENLRQELAEVDRVARKGRITVLPLGMDLAPFAEMPRNSGKFRAAWGIPDDAPLIGTIGRLVNVKNHALFLDAAAQVLAELPAARFVLVGDGILRDELERQAASLGIADRVIFTGWQQNIAPIYSDLDVSVISSHTEGTPGSVIESLAAGCPVVATAVGGVPDLLDGGALGTMSPPGNSVALAQAIVRTVSNPPDPGVAQATMLDRYSIGRLVTDLDSLYHGLLAKKDRESAASP